MAELEDAAAAAPAAATNQTRAQTPPPTPPPNQSEDERPTPPPTPPQPSTPEAPIKPPEDWRVKVYRLNDEGQWDDRGTGRVSLAGARVLVVSEGDRSEVLLASAPRGPNPVSRQGENILTWDACRGDDGSALADDQPSLRRGETACVGFIVPGGARLRCRIGQITSSHCDKTVVTTTRRPRPARYLSRFLRTETKYSGRRRGRHSC